MAICVDKKIVFVNMHLPMNSDFRLPQSNHVAKYIKSIDMAALITGDMNTFPDGFGPKQIYDFQRISGSYEATSIIRSKTNSKVRVLKTFSPYPYDKVPKNIIPLNLYHILIFYLE